MNTFFEISDEDFKVVARAHGVTLTDEQVESLTGFDDEQEAKYIDGVSNMVDLDDQTTVVHGNIETHLMELGIIPEGPSKFEVSDDDDDDLEDEDFDDFDEDDED